MPRKRMPFEVLIALQNQLDVLSPRNAKRKELIEETCEAFGISASTVRRQLRTHQLPYLTHRSDYNKSRSLPEADQQKRAAFIDQGLYWTPRKVQH